MKKIILLMLAALLLSGCDSYCFFTLWGDPACEEGPAPEAQPCAYTPWGGNTCDPPQYEHRPD